MAKMLPDLPDAQLAEVPSKAEVKVYLALKEFLSAEFIVFFKSAGSCNARMKRRATVKQTFWCVIRNLAFLLLR